MIFLANQSWARERIKKNNTLCKNQSNLLDLLEEIGFAKSSVNCQLGFFLKAADHENSELWC